MPCIIVTDNTIPGMHDFRSPFSSKQGARARTTKMLASTHRSAVTVAVTVTATVTVTVIVTVAVTVAPTVSVIEKTSSY